MDCANTIFNEDCINTMSNMDAKSTNLVITSPPYNIIRPNSTDRCYDVYKDGIEMATLPRNSVESLLVYAEHAEGELSESNINKMSKEVENIDLAERRALNIPVVMWRWYACTFGNKLPFEEHNFTDFDEMKRFSARHSKIYKTDTNKYVSGYDKVNAT